MKEQLLVLGAEEGEEDGKKEKRRETRKLGNK
jgi:hypothetical protein